MMTSIFMLPSHQWGGADEVKMIVSGNSLSALRLFFYWGNSSEGYRRTSNDCSFRVAIDPDSWSRADTATVPATLNMHDENLTIIPAHQYRDDRPRIWKTRYKVKHARTPISNSPPRRTGRRIYGDRSRSSRCVTYGKTLDEAIRMAREAIELYIEILAEKGEDIPTEDGILEYTLTVGAHA